MGFQDQMAGFESSQAYVPSMTTGWVGDPGKTIQLTFGAPPEPEVAVAGHGPSVPCGEESPMVPEGSPRPTFQ
jgi:hypothetical protein